MRKFSIFKKGAIGMIAALAMVSCTNEVLDNEPALLKAEGMATSNYGIIPGENYSSGKWITTSMKFDFSGAYLTHNATLSSEIDLNKWDQWAKFSVGGRAFNGDYYTLNNPFEKGSRGVVKWSKGNFSNPIKLETSSKEVEMSQLNEVNFTLFDATHGYVTDAETQKFGVIKEFNPSTMSYTEVEFDLSEAEFKVDNKEDLYVQYYEQKTLGAKMLIRRGNYLYADLIFGDSRNKLRQIVQYGSDCYVAVIDVTDGRLVNVLKGEGATNIGLFNDHPLVCIDPMSKNIYFSAVGEMYSGDKSSKIFMIDENNNIFEKADYKSVNGKNGQFNTLYVYNNVIFTKLAKYSADYKHYFDFGEQKSYRADMWEYYMIKNGTPKKININDTDNFYAFQQPQLINNRIYVICNNSGSAKVYSFRPNGTDVKVETTGIAGGFGHGVAFPNKISSIVKL